MNMGTTKAIYMYHAVIRLAGVLSLYVAIIFSFTGCTTASSASPYVNMLSEHNNKRVFNLEYISCDQGVAFLSKLGISDVLPMPETNAILVAGSPELLHRIGLIFDLVDEKEDFVIEDLGPISNARTFPSNSQIATAIGDIMIGTFDDPPQTVNRTQGIIDIQGNSVLAILPTRYQSQLHDVIAQAVSQTEPIYNTLLPGKPSEPNHADGLSETCIDVEPMEQETKISKQEVAPIKTRAIQMPNKGQTHGELKLQTRKRARPERSVSSHSTRSSNSRTQNKATRTSSFATIEDDDSGDSDAPKTLRLILKPAKNTTENEATTEAESVAFQNGDDTIDLVLPKTMPLIQLLHLVGEYLDLDYLYDPATIGDQSVALMLRGSLQGKMRVKDLYSLLETVLKFKGLAMIRGKDNLVTIIPVAQALDADPQLVDVSKKSVQAGDIVVTRVFELHYVGVSSIANMLQNMKLGIAVSQSEEAQILFVTCYAHRMKRIEQLVNMLDRPGKLRECRFRRLEYTTASALADKVKTLAQELRGIPVTMASVAGKPPGKGSDSSGSTGPGQPVYLDTDERTNRIVMIGHEERLDILEELINILDVVQEDLRTPKTYNVNHMKAQEALRKLQELEVIANSTVSTTVKPRSASSGTPTSAKTSGTDSALTEDPLVVVLEATNQLLIRATQEQHTQIGEFLDYIDVSPEDLRILKVYEIHHVDAEQVRNKLEELEIIGRNSARPPRINDNRSTKPANTESALTNMTNSTTVLTDEPQVVVTESTNSLLVNATAEQHAQIDTIIKYVDSKMSEEEMPYRIYPLENSSPKHVADILQQLIQEETVDKEGKIERPIKKEEQITIVPDPNTFSLVVHANKKNHEWIENLTESLDKRRPQVLIDVTLVEITRTDTFEYDLGLIASAQEAVIDNIGIEPIHRIDSKSRVEGGFNQLDQDGNPTGQTKAFYSDEKVQALLTAIKRKNYGRVLAKPKILVDDGQQGDISTTEETTYLKESIQVPNQGSPITTRDFEPIEAMIQLQITPHISEGDLLRLDVHLAREDFGTRPREGAPPDKATSQVTTTVFVPDNHTVILGGLVKLNQSKGGTKVPILGDVPLVGAVFRSVDNSDVEKKLYVFLKANIVRPYDGTRLADLQRISDEQQKAFEKSEAEFQKHEDIPGIKPETMQPERVLGEL